MHQATLHGVENNVRDRCSVAYKEPPIGNGIWQIGIGVTTLRQEEAIASS